MNVTLVGFPNDTDKSSIRKWGEGLFTMPSIRPEISIGNLLSIAVSGIAIFSVVVTLAVFGTNMRADIDRAKLDIVDIKTNLTKQASLNETNASFQAEVRVDLKYMREALDRIENRNRVPH